MNVDVDIRVPDDIPEGMVAVNVKYSGDDMPTRITLKIALPETPGTLTQLEQLVNSYFDKMKQNWERNRYIRFPRDTAADQREALNILKEQLNK